MEVGLRGSKLGLGATVGSLGAALLLAFVALQSTPKVWLLEYYAGTALDGPVTRAWIRQADFDVPNVSLLRGLPNREDFSLRIHSCLILPAAGAVAFRLKADDRARLYVDGALVLDSAVWPTKKKKGKGKPGDASGGKLDMMPGRHAISIEYVNVHGSGSLGLTMAPPGGHEFRSLRTYLARPSSSGKCDKP